MHITVLITLEKTTIVKWIAAHAGCASGPDAVHLRSAGAEPPGWAGAGGSRTWDRKGNSFYCASERKSNRRLWLACQRNIDHSRAEPIVIKPFHPKEGAWEGTENVLSSCSIKLPNLPQLYCRHFPPTICFAHRVHTKPLYLERGL